MVHDAEELNLRGMARRIRDLADRARTKRLSLDDISGGTFSITNAGPFGTFLTGAIINQPQVAILSTDGVSRKPVVVELPDGTESIAIHSVGLVAMTFDHRAVDGAYVARFLARLSEILERPRLGRRAVGRRRVPPDVRTGAADEGPLARAGSPTAEAWALQRAPQPRAPRDDYLLLLEHPHVYTLGSHADPEHVLVDPASVGAELVEGRPGRRRHLPRSRPAGRLPGPSPWAPGSTAGPSTCTGSSRWSSTPWSRSGSRRHRRRPAAPGTPACGSVSTSEPVPGPPGPPQDLRHRGADLPGSDDARLRPQRRPRPRRCSTTSCPAASPTSR